MLHDRFQNKCHKTLCGSFNQTVLDLDPIQLFQHGFRAGSEEMRLFRDPQRPGRHHGILVVAVLLLLVHQTGPP